ncbi:GTP-binding protein [Virgibacillus profundi]|uniref:GTP-binding protein n=1 Tax=Virgibacillus profundi TaxID=2024555 RepID=A0A2A2IBT1_9BACI|nr:putative glycoside hydrolase [Virgibacillus profundi]PAV29189.1 GTP-binding protein [Virgibacillus profundi]PXY53358.1 GTP-binding protein [Virgibacillus profundi]
MRRSQHRIFTVISVLLLCFLIPITSSGEETLQASVHKERQTSLKLIDTDKHMKRFTYDSGYNFEYPDAVRGIYVTGNSAGGSRFETLLDLVENSDLNAMVIDIKEDHGNLTFKPKEGSPYEDIAKNFISDPESMMQVLEEKGIYPIARIVVFKDSVLAKKRPDLSFTKNGEVWVNNKGEAFVSPFQKEVWEYNVEIAKMAAEMGFQEIQFDYVRFPEGFESYDSELQYSLGDYEDSELNNIKKRVEAVTDFVAYAKEELEYYDVDVAVDIFGYAATIEETPGIGQNFSRISNNVDVISSMIYPSHWTSYFGIKKPDMEPYKLVTEYAKVENEVLGALEEPPVSRPWIQDFEAPWLYSGATKQYGKAEVEAQIKALYENDIYEFLLWNAGNTYTKNVDYKIGLE